MKSKILILLASTLTFCQCGGQNRPDGPEAEAFLDAVNAAAKPLPYGNPSELYGMLSADFIARMEDEIQKARTMDSADLQTLPQMEMLRVLALKNSLANPVRYFDAESVIKTWFDSAGKGFPLENADRFYYTPDSRLETEMLNEGSTVPLILLTETEGGLKADLFHTEDVQARRLANILSETTMDELTREAAWLHFQTDRTIHWGPLVER